MQSSARSAQRRRRAAAGAAILLFASLGASASSAIPATASAIPATANAHAAWRNQVNLTRHAVFAMSNDRHANVVVAYNRNRDGTLDEVGRYRTRGKGSGSFEDSANGLVLATVRGEAAPNNLIEPGSHERQFLLATNAGSNSISVFAVHRHRLRLVEVQRSHGEKPVSVTVNRGRVFVLNSGETNDNLFDAAGQVIPNCTTGRRPTIAGFSIARNGALEPLPGSVRHLSGKHVSGCAQVTFDPTGRVLVVTERLAQPRYLHQQRSSNERLDDEGVVNTFRVRRDGSVRRHRVTDATGQGPFGFTFTKNGELLTTEQFDGPAGPGRGAATSYRIRRNGSLVRTAPSLWNGGTDTCWIVATDGGRLAFSTSFFGNGRISSYRLDDIGITRVLRRVATGPTSTDDGVDLGASDISLSRSSRYLYQLNSVQGTITAFKNNFDGTLTRIEQQAPFPQPAFGPGGGQAAPVGLAAS